ncbi:TcaA 3rd/4th domain-containing protein [Alkalicoccus halolimnae]|uniref:Zinc-ribbon domain-containing protein n=1 Tax=Alkalicoccus halolimnae TaxID=1667239 RepID=A0AAJ8LVN6_9BACI
MKFCTKCGRELKETHAFCPNCRAEVNGSTADEASEKAARKTTAANVPPPASAERPAASPRAKKPRPPMSKRNKWIAAGIGAAAVILIPAHLVLSSATSPDKALGDFQDAIDSEDAAALAQLLHVKETGEPITEEHAASIIDYMHSSPSVIESFYSFLDDQMEIFTSAEAGEAAENYQPLYDVQFLSFENTGSRFLFYDQYQIGVESYPLYVRTNYEDASFQVNGEEVDAEVEGNGNVFLGNYPAGSYHLKATGDGELADLALEDQLFLTGNNYPSHMDFDLDYAYISSSVDGARLFVNGEETEEELQTTQNEYGPFLMDESTEIHAEAETPFGTMTSEPITLTGGYGSHVLELEAPAELVSEAVEDVEEDILSSNEGPVQGLGSTELLESIDFYTDNYLLSSDVSDWKLEIEAEESWLIGSESFSTGEIVINPLSEVKQYTLRYDETADNWTFDQADYLFTVSDPSSAVTTLAVNDAEELNASAGAGEAEVDDIASGGNIISMHENVYVDEENFGEEGGEALNDYVEYPEEYLNTLMNNYYMSYAAALYDVEFSRIVSENHDFFTYVAPEASDFEAELLSTIEDHADSGESIYFLIAEVTDFETDDNESYRVFSEVEFEVVKDNGDIVRQVLETEHDVLLTENGFFVEDMIETEVISEEPM